MFYRAALLIVLSVVVPALALGPAEDEAAARAAKFSMRQAIEAALKKHPGFTLRTVEFEVKSRGAKYEIELFSKDKQVKIDLSAGGGEVLQSETEEIREDRRAEFGAALEHAKTADFLKALEVAEKYVPGAVVLEAEWEHNVDGSMELEVDLVENGKQIRIDVNPTTLQIIKAFGKPPISGAHIRGDSIVFNFDSDTNGSLPIGWRTREATPEAKANSKPSKDPIAVWAVSEDAAAPSPKHVLTLTSIASSGSGENACMPTGVTFATGTIEVKVRLDSTGGPRGIGVRLFESSAGNSITLENDGVAKKMRLVRTIAGVREVLAEGDNTFTSGVWHTLLLDVKADQIRCSLDGSGVVQAKITAAEVGAVTIWTNPATSASFDSVILAPTPAKTTPP